MKHIGMAFVIAGMLVALLAMPLLFEQVPMNRWYGVRIAKACESAQHWYAINRVGGQWLAIYGLALVAAGALPIFTPSLALSSAYRFVPLLLLPLFLLPVLVYSSRLK